MANYYCTARTNYVRVKDIDALEAALANSAVRMHKDEEGRIALFDAGGDQNGFWFWNPGVEPWTDEDPIDPVEFLAPHLEDDEVWIFVEAGAEKYRYVTGLAFAFNSKGEVRSVNIDSIYKLAEELGTNITTATY